MSKPNDVTPLSLWLAIISLALFLACLWFLFFDPALATAIRDARDEAMPHHRQEVAYDLTMIADTEGGSR